MSPMADQLRDLWAGGPMGGGPVAAVLPADRRAGLDLVDQTLTSAAQA
jgi:hypothetical protein